MRQPSTHDAIVIGAGPAGASTALALARRGWAVAIVEKSVFPRRKVCGEYISASNLALLDRLRIGDAWRAEAGPEIRRVGLFCGDSSIEAPMPGVRSGPAARDGFGRALGRDILDSLLLDAARSAGAEVFQPWRAVAIERDRGRQAVRIEDEKSRDEAMLLAPVIVAAHGSWEPGPLPSQLEKQSRPSDLLGFKAHFTGSSLPPDLMPLLTFPGGYGGMVMADHGRMSISCCIRRDMLVRLRGSLARERGGHVSAAEAVEHHIMATCRGARAALQQARLDGPWLAAGPIRPGIRAGYEKDIFRVGNAAGESHPIIAEGISMALQSGWLLALELGAAAGGQGQRDAAGRRYGAAWRGLFSTRVLAAEAIARIALGPSGAALMEMVVRNFPPALTLGARLSGKTKPVPGLADARLARSRTA
ncbi:FAD-dependent oxidoreductase [Mesorhizobium sp.]|uniref:NAD(P)/FAD-dependent oxidoreductase n=1 Tax=Mesorhizobium sp. TaxID=1871066 RepID=UPI000FE3FBD2|nr:FAD-dependent oxidoreductase [Mesorhizobium sp.]RWG79833.1 MAG: FAD-dependent oxidoreductase [Mesorhizobium sp.]RWG83447.1 MAG: FAD-dependent oxidoreductase [Mesorhizobium sp.]RWK02950.1 MAG: FAD-dependent oxidoreductase [Mesorhizobium sp.]RWK11670.1 MAG: FAD-dependent oxidoreductase [Mesorhizobium sp.]RWK14450.1 MAG: FAD-dependent oxidoreductase [Mesorhizobium sp.]